MNSLVLRLLNKDRPFDLAYVSSQVNARHARDSQSGYIIKILASLHPLRLLSLRINTDRVIKPLNRRNGIIDSKWKITLMHNLLHV